MQSSSDLTWALWASAPAPVLRGTLGGAAVIFWGSLAIPLDVEESLHAHAELSMKSSRPGGLRRALASVIPPPDWRLPVSTALGVLTGLGLLILRVSNAVSYLSDEPRTCVNCHVMAPQYATWQHSSHTRGATCTDCHVPHDNILRKYAFKAADGLRHAYVFTFRLEPQIIQIKEAGKAAVQENCIRCHEPVLARVAIRGVSFEGSRHGQGHLCWDCHRETPHSRVNSLASAPYARVPRKTPAVPEWISNYLQQH